MNFKLATGLAIACALAFATPTVAKTKKKPKAVAISGVYCEQGGQSAFIPAAEIKPSIRSKIRKGQRFKFNYPGYGPISCVGY
jgi:hypothetical protein